VIVENDAIYRFPPQCCATQVFGQCFVFGQLGNIGGNNGIGGYFAKAFAVIGNKLSNATCCFGAAINTPTTTYWRTISAHSRQHRNGI
jgi:hypothetical protein